MFTMYDILTCKQIRLYILSLYTHRTTIVTAVLAGIALQFNDCLQMDPFLSLEAVLSKSYDSAEYFTLINKSKESVFLSRSVMLCMYRTL